MMIATHILSAPDDVFRVPDVQLSERAMTELAAILGLDGDDDRLADMKQQAEFGAARYLRQKRQDAWGPPTAKIAAQLRQLARGVGSPREVLRPLYDDVLWRTWIAYRHKDPGSFYKLVDWPDIVCSWSAVPETLARAAARALETMPHKRGRRPNVALALFIAVVCGIYEKLSGKPVTHNPYRKTEYTGEPWSPGGRFVLTIVRDVDPTVHPQTVSAALQGYIRARNVALQQTNPVRKPI